MSNIRVSKDKNNPYVMLNKAFLEDPKISLKLKGLIAYCMTKPDNWVFKVSHLKTVLKEGVEALRSTINEGIKHGYIEREELKENGRFTGLDYVIHEVKLKKIVPKGGFPAPDKSALENKTQVNNELSKKKKILKEKDSPTAQTPRGKASRTAATSKITFNKLTRSFENISQEDIQAWKNKYPAVNILHEIDLCAEWAVSAPRQNYRKSLLTWFGNVTKNRTTPYVPKAEEKATIQSDVVEINKKKAEIWETEAEKRGIRGAYAIQAMPSKISFVMPNNAGYEVSYENLEKEFEKKCQSALNRMNLKINTQNY